MYTFMLFSHNIFRWLLLVAGVVAVVMAFVGWLGKKDWPKRDNSVGLVYIILMDVNVLLGFILYLFLSPLTQAAFADFGAAMGNSTLRFFAVEHIFGMLLALVFAHVGRSFSKKAGEPLKKHRTAAIWFTLSLVAVLAMIPWDRPLLQGPF